MIEYNDVWDNKKLVDFIKKISDMTSKNKIIWKMIREDIPTYITNKPFVMKNTDFYASLQDSTLEISLEVDSSKFALENNASKERKHPTLFKILSHHSSNILNMEMKRLILIIKSQIKEQNEDKLNKESLRIDSLLTDFLKE